MYCVLKGYDSDVSIWAVFCLNDSFIRRMDKQLKSLIQWNEKNNRKKRLQTRMSIFIFQFMCRMF